MLTFHYPCPGALRRALLPCLVVLAACEGKSGVLTDYQLSGSTTEAATTDVSATGTTDVSATGTSATSEVSQTEATVGTTETWWPPGLCEDPSQEVVGPEVTVTVRNAGVADIFVLGGGFCSDPPFSLEDASGEPMITWIGASCPPSCSLVLEFGECGCPDIGCQPGVIRLTPGGSYEATWSGVHYLIAEVLEECVPEQCAGGSCSAPQQTEPGAYTFIAHGNAAFTCTLDDCSCEPNAQGWCMVPEAVLEPAITAEAVLTYPDDGAVELVFQ